MKLSIVTTMFFSAPYINEFYERASAEARKYTEDYEIILVNDGSPDKSLEAAVAVHENDRHVKVVDLSRNFGHYKAIMTGLSHARGDLVFLVDCDLEEKPELLSVFLDAMKRTGADAVYGVQHKRKGGFFERVSGRIFYSLFNLLSDHPISHNELIARLMTKRYVESLLDFREQEVFLAGIMALTGYHQEPVVVEKLHKGATTYNLSRKISVFVNSITSFSNKPLIFIFFLGLIVSMISAGAACYLLIQRIFFRVYNEGWPSLIVSVWLIGGIMIFCLGIIGIYLSKIFMETKARPYTVVRKVYSHTDEE